MGLHCCALRSANPGRGLRRAPKDQNRGIPACLRLRRAPRLLPALNLWTDDELRRAARVDRGLSADAAGQATPLFLSSPAFVCASLVLTSIDMGTETAAGNTPPSWKSRPLRSGRLVAL